MPGVHEPLTEQLLEGAFPATDPYPLFARLRAEAPIAWCADPGFWAVSRMDDVLTVATDTTTYCSSKGILGDGDRHRLRDAADDDAHRSARTHRIPGAGLAAASQAGGRGDGCLGARPGHRRWSTPCRSTNRSMWSPRSAVPFPIQVIADLLGLGDADVPRLYEWSEAVIPGATDLSPERAGELALEMTLYLMAEAAKRRGPGDDLISTVASGRAGWAPTQRRRGGHVPHPAAGGRQRNHPQPGVGRLGRFRPAARPVAATPRRPIADPLRGRGVAAVDVACVVVHAHRDTATTLGEVDIAAGDHLLLLYGSADRDEDVFGATADRLDVGRTPEPPRGVRLRSAFLLGCRAWLGSRPRCCLDCS